MGLEKREKVENECYREVKKRGVKEGEYKEKKS